MVNAKIFNAPFKDAKIEKDALVVKERKIHCFIFRDK